MEKPLLPPVTEKLVNTLDLYERLKTAVEPNTVLIAVGEALKSCLEHELPVNLGVENSIEQVHHQVLALYRDQVLAPLQEDLLAEALEELEEEIDLTAGNLDFFGAAPIETDQDKTRLIQRYEALSNSRLSADELKAIYTFFPTWRAEVTASWQDKLDTLTDQRDRLKGLDEPGRSV